MIPYFDAHCDTVSHSKWYHRLIRKNEGHLDLERLSAFRKAAQCFAIFHPLAKAPEDGMLAVCRRQQSFFAEQMAANADLALQCRTGEEIRAANAAGKVAAILTCEGSELLNCDPANLEWAQQVGIRAINLTWNHANLISGTNKHETERGLNNLGRAFVKEAQRRDILIDVSHCSDAAFWDLMEITEKPVLASHSDARAVCPHSRNLTDDMFRALMETGGVVGINYCATFIRPDGKTFIEDVVKHIDHFMELGGEKNVGLGSDFDGCTLPGDLTGVQDMPALWEALSRRGYKDELLEDIFYNNMLRIF